MSKKIVKLNEQDIEKMVSRIIKEGDEDFKSNYSSNLMQIERGHLKDSDKLTDIISVYESHIRQLRSIMNNQN